MKTHLLQSSAFLVFLSFFATAAYARNGAILPARKDLKEEYVTYTAGGVTMNGYVVYDQNRKGKRPAVLVVPEWWGFTNYPRSRARQLAELGYIAMAVDLYGNGKVAANPQEAQALAGPFYQHPEMAKERLDAAIRKIRSFPETDPSNIAAIGYCFGGGMVLNAANMGADLKGVVSFHGSLAGVKANKNLLKAKILVCHGADDKFVSRQDVAEFRHKMDSIGANYTFKVYPNATHAFTNPEATKLGQEFKMPIAYNPEADKQSWNDMKRFLANVFS